MKQLALDIGLATGPTLDNFHAGPNAQALQHLRLAVGDGAAPCCVSRPMNAASFWPTK